MASLEYNRRRDIFAIRILFRLKRPEFIFLGDEKKGNLNKAKFTIVIKDIDKANKSKKDSQKEIGSIIINNII